MLKSHEKFHSTNGHRRILVADDELINREMLGAILQPDYEVLFAKDGIETMEMIRQNKDTLSLVLLDILMPGKSGLEILKEAKEDPELQIIPVIVTTAEKDTEIESLKLGAIDFIPKPYPAPGVIQARVQRTIELSEDRDIIMSTERDELTGLYNREYFYRYAEQYDQFHKDAEMDAIVVDVNRFHILNERYGRSYGNEVLKKIGEHIKASVSDSEGIVCRREADTFMVYCPHREDYKHILDQASVSLAEANLAEDRVHLRLGIYSNVDKNIEMERRFDRAKMAADTVRNNLNNPIGYYDHEMHKREMYAEQLIEAFPQAIEEKQFVVYYQPKFDVRPETPILTSAEALIRWDHPELGLVSPGLFIPLFEENGLIRKLDTYVWRESAIQIRKWKDELGYSIPVSVNVSRIDMYDAGIKNTLQSIVDEFGLETKDLFLEVTESAYTEDSQQIIQVASELREVGFQIEMDDFGTGYSSLNMISDLPIDALKLDMQFIRSAFKDGGNTRMLEVIIDISKYLHVPVIAEGVETEDQLHALKGLGCDIVQGYFFSKPVPAEEFEAFLLQKKEADLANALKPDTSGEDSELTEEDLRTRLNVLRYTEDTEEQETSSSPENTRSGIHLRTASIFFVIIAFMAACALLVADISVTGGYRRMKEASDRYIAAQLAASNMESGSDYLTECVRCFVVTGEVEYLNDFFEEVNVTRRRDRAVEDLEELLEDSDSEALLNLNTALSLSNELIEFEKKAMRLMIERSGYNMSEVPAKILEIELTDEEKAMSAEELKDRAQQLVFDSNYMHYKDKIRENVSLCTQALIRASSQELESASSQLSLLVNMQTILTIVFLIFVLAIVLMITLLIRRPLSRMVSKMQNQEKIVPEGAEELRFVTRTYNNILDENAKARARLSRAASHDALTGLFNRGAYNLLIESADTEHMALILIDVDNFKEINDTYGHAVGDRVLKRVADVMKQSFRSVDILCRLGGDEFAVVMTRSNSSMSRLVVNKMNRMNEILQHPKDDLPPVSVSVGIAFSDRKNPQGDIFRDADTALYQVKEAGRSGCAVFE